MRSFQFQVEGAIHPVIGLGGRNPWMLDPDDLASSFSLYPTAIININSSPPPDIVTLFGSFTSTTFVQTSLPFFGWSPHSFFFWMWSFLCPLIPSLLQEKIYWIRKEENTEKYSKGYDSALEIDHHPPYPTASRRSKKIKIREISDSPEWSTQASTFHTSC